MYNKRGLYNISTAILSELLKKLSKVEKIFCRFNIQKYKNTQKKKYGIFLG